MFGDLFRRWLAAKFLLQLLGHLIQLADPAAKMSGDTDGTAVIGQRPGYRLANPPGSIGTETVTTTVIILFNRLHQAHIAFLNQVQELQAPSSILLGNANHQPGISPDQMGSGGVANFPEENLFVHLIKSQAQFFIIKLFFRFAAGLDLFSQLDFFFGRQ